MRVLVTGYRGLVGTHVGERLRAEGHETVPFDLADGRDVRDGPAVDAAARGCDAVIHAAALLGREGEAPEEIAAVNVQGTWNVLVAAVRTGVSRVVFLSSVDVFGVFKGERAPDYLPLDDDHPLYAATPYGISKRIGEDLCRLFCAMTPLTAVALRPPGVWTGETYSFIADRRSEHPEFEWHPFWEYGAFIDARDLAAACAAALRCDVGGFSAVSVCSPDISTSGRTSRELCRDLHPGVEWRGGAAFEADPYASLIRLDRARTVLGWEPVHTWREFMSRR